MNVQGFLFFVLLIVFSTLKSVSSGELISSPPVTNWGTWGRLERCPNGTFVQAFQLLTEAWKGPGRDDTCLNGIKLFCGDPMNDVTVSVTSSVGKWGKWGHVFTCGSSGRIFGFRLRVEKPAWIKQDETATNNMRIFCSNGAPGAYLVGDGERFGDWTDPRYCASDEAVCGIQTQVQSDQGFFGDNTALNNVAMECCKVV